MLDPRTLAALSLEEKEEEKYTKPTSPRPPSPARNIPASTQSVGVKVLVADDNAIARSDHHRDPLVGGALTQSFSLFRRILTMFLTKKGVDFVEAQNGEVAVEKFRVFRPNIVWCESLPFSVLSARQS